MVGQRPASDLLQSGAKIGRIADPSPQSLAQLHQLLDGRIVQPSSAGAVGGNRPLGPR
jgi:hypothetical protein